MVFKVGSYARAATSGAGTESFVHGLGDLPKAMILWTSNQTADTSTPGAGGGFLGIGFSDGAENGSVGYGALDEPGSGSNSSARRLNSSAIQIIDGSGTLSLEGTVSFSATQVTFTWSTRSTTAQTIINYLLIGGDRLESDVQQWSLGTSNAVNRAVTVGFKPNICFHLWSGPTSAALGGAGEGAGSIGLGAMDLAGNQWVSYTHMSDANNPTRGYRLTSSSSMFAVLDDTYDDNPPTGGPDRTASFASMDASGFTVDTNGTTTVDVKAFALCLQNIHAKVGVFTRVGTTTPESQDITGLSFTPAAVLLGTSQATTNTTNLSTHSRLAIGASTATAHAVASAISEHNEATPESYSFQRDDASALIANGTAGGVTGYGSLSSFISSPTGGFTYTWSPNQVGGGLQIYGYAALATPTSTAVDLDTFAATRSGDRLGFRWRTGREVNTLGFHVLEERAGVRRRLTPGVIAGSALLVGGQQALNGGDAYEWSTAAGPESAGASYWLEEIDLQGQSTLHGPFAPRTAVDSGPLQQTRSLLLSELGRRSPLPEAGPAGDQPLSFLPGRPLRSPGVDATWAVPAGPAVKIQVKHEGLFRLGQPALLAAGLDPGVDPRRLRLYSDGRELPVRITGEDDGRLDADDALEFHGQGVDTPHTDTRTYWLAASRGHGRRMMIDRPAGRAPAATGFPFTVEDRQRSVYFAALLNGDGDNFFGPLLSPAPVTRTVEVHHLEPGATRADLRLSLQGVSETPHRVSVSLNGRALGPVEWSNRDLHQATISVPVGPEGLVEGTNTLSFATAVATDVALLDHLQLTYRHRLAADDDAQRISLPEAAALAVEGFTSTDVRAFDVTDPADTRELPVTTESRERDVVASVVSGRPGPRTVLLVGGRRIRTPVAVANRPSSLREPQRGAELVILTHPTLAPAAAPLVALREEQGRPVMVVDVEDVYDEFNWGHKDPRALREFLRQAQRRFRTPPKHVLLLGDASIDPRNFLGAGDNDLVPTRLVDIAPLQTASDDWFADFADRGVADMAMGRIPARTLAEATAIISKLVRHEQSWTGEQNGALLLADTPSAEDDFQELSRQAATGLPPWLPLDVRVRGQSGFTDAAGLVTAINVGPLLVNYVGHGSVGLWRGSLATEHVAQLQNRDRPSLVVAMTCLNGLFQDPRNTTLAEALLAAPQGGAFAVWTSSGFTGLAGQAELNRAFLRAALSDRLPLGEAANVAKAEAGSSPAGRTWILFGDPSRTLTPGLAGRRARPEVPGSCAVVMRPSPSAGFGAVAALSLLALGLLARRRR